MNDDGQSINKSLKDKAEYQLDQDGFRKDNISNHDIKTLVHDLRVHQIELELQNEELRDTQKQLESTRDRFVKLYNDAPVGYLTVDRNGIIVQVNQTFATMSGKEPAQISGKPLVDLIFFEDKSSFLGRYKSFFKNPDQKQLDFRLTGRKKELWVRVTGRIEDGAGVYSPDGERCLLLAVSDVSSQVIAEKRLLESEQMFRTLFMQSPFSIFIHDKDSGEIIDANPTAYSTYGYSNLEELKSSEFWVAPPYSFNEALDLIHKAANEGPQHFEWFNRKASGDLVWQHVRLIRITINGIDRVLATCMDITEQKEAEQKIKQANEHLEKANIEKDMLFSIIAHDLKSPMSGILGSSALLAGELETLSSKEIRDISTGIHKSVSNVMFLLDDLMKWSLMVQGGMGYSPEQNDLGELIRAGMETVKDSAWKKNITIQFDIPEKLQILADKKMVSTVIRNVASNAVKFTHHGGKIWVTVRKTASLVKICVQDEGIGMNENVLSTIFLVDKNKRQYGTDGERGTGLGLILCKEFVEKHGGEIWVESEPGKGTKVCFTLPYDQDSSKE
ncbi:MAG: PAS domain S-box protein [Desulfonatronovibrio sp.]